MTGMQIELRRYKMLSGAAVSVGRGTWLGLSTARTRAS